MNTPALLAIDTEAVINAPCPAVHAFATNAARWQRWHPATRGVEGVPDRPLHAGETIVEHIAVGTLRFTATWTVLEAQAPTFWVIAADTPQGRARITYRLTPARGGAATLFHRRLECRSKGWRHWLDPLMVRLVLVPQSRRALRRLKRVIESGG